MKEAVSFESKEECARDRVGLLLKVVGGPGIRYTVLEGGRYKPSPNVRRNCVMAAGSQATGCHGMCWPGLAGGVVVVFDDE